MCLWCASFWLVVTANQLYEVLLVGKPDTIQIRVFTFSYTDHFFFASSAACGGLTVAESLCTAAEVSVVKWISELLVCVSVCSCMCLIVSPPFALWLGAVSLFHCVFFNIDLCLTRCRFSSLLCYCIKKLTHNSPCRVFSFNTSAFRDFCGSTFPAHENVVMMASHVVATDCEVWWQATICWLFYFILFYFNKQMGV